jgi:hypothetical protein
MWCCLRVNNRVCFALFFLSFLFPVIAQESFLTVFESVNAVRIRNDKLLSGKDIDKNDSVAKRIWINNKVAVWDTIATVSRRVHGTTFPDITFTDLDEKSHSISEFSGAPVVVYFYHYYCQSCGTLIDTTLKRLNKRTRMILLLSDDYRKDLKELLNYAPNVSSGTISQSTVEMIGLRQGTDVMYYLDGDRKVEFFRKMMLGNSWTDWRVFLAEKNNNGSN